MAGGNLPPVSDQIQQALGVKGYWNQLPQDVQDAITKIAGIIEDPRFSGDQQKSMLQQLQQNAGGGLVQTGLGGDVQLPDANKVNGILGGLQNATQGAMAQPDPYTGPTTVISAPPTQTSSGQQETVAPFDVTTATLNPEQQQQPQGTLNQVNSIKGYAGEATTQFGDWNALAQTGNQGMQDIASFVGEPLDKLQSEYDAYRQQFAAAKRLAGSDAQAGAVMSFPDWANQRAQAVQGVWRPVLDFFSQTWALQTNGQPMPTAIRQKLLQQLNSLDPEMQRQLQDALLAYQGAGGANIKTGQGQPAAGASFDPSQLAAIMGTASPAQAAATLQSMLGGNVTAMMGGGLLPDSIWTTFQTALQQTPQSQQSQVQSAENSQQSALIKQLVAMGLDPNQKQANGQTLIQTIINSGQDGIQKYLDAYGNLDAVWQDYFGRQPTNQEVMWAMGKSKQDLVDFALDSPSRVDGVSIGKYQAYQKFANDVSNQMWGVGAGDNLIKQLHQSVNSK